MRSALKAARPVPEGCVVWPRISLSVTRAPVTPVQTTQPPAASEAALAGDSDAAAPRIVRAKRKACDEGHAEGDAACAAEAGSERELHFRKKHNGLASVRVA
jgi:hypothetical protein